MRKNLLILLTLCLSFIGYSQTFTENYITYQVLSNSSNVIIIDYDMAGGTAVDILNTVIDTSVVPNVTYSVTNIGVDAFRNKGLTQVTIENGIIDISMRAFRENQLSSVVIPNSVMNIGLQSFRDNVLTSVVIPDNITTIGSGAFFNNLLQNVSIPDSVTSIETVAFANNQLTSITIPDNVASIGLGAFLNNQLTSITIPENVTNIGDVAFNSNPLTCIISEATTPSGITTGANDSFGINRSNIDLSIPTGTASAYTSAQWTGFNSVAEGLSGTFVVDNITYQINATPNNEVTITDYNAAGGTVVNIPAIVSSGCTDFSVTDIGTGAFNNIGITSATIPNTVTNIGTQSFASNQINQLTFLTPSSLTNIGFGAFEFNQLTSVIIPDSVTNIESGAFASNQLTSVTISDNVTSLESAVFINNQLTSIAIPSSVTIIGDAAFQNNPLTSVVIPSNVTSIGERAFLNNQLTSVTISASVISIEERAFYNNPLLTNVTSLATTPPTINTTGDIFDTFADDRSTIHLHIPAGTMGAYVTGPGALWTGFNPVSEDALSVSDFELVNNIKVITATNEIQVISPDSVRLENYTIYTISGAKVSTGNQSEIISTSFSKGIYILKLDFDRGTIVKKIIIK